MKKDGIKISRAQLNVLMDLANGRTVRWNYNTERSCATLRERGLVDQLGKVTPAGLAFIGRGEVPHV